MQELLPTGWIQLPTIDVPVNASLVSPIVVPGLSKYRTYFLVLAPYDEPTFVVSSATELVSAIQLLEDKPLPLGPYFVDQHLWLHCTTILPSAHIVKMTPFVSLEGELGLPPYACCGGTDLTAVWAAILALQGDVGVLQGQMGLALADIGTLQADMTTAQADIGTLQADMTTAQADIGTLQADMTTAQADIGTLQADMTTAQADIGTLQADMTTAQADIAALQIEIEQRPSGLNGVFGYHMRINYPFLPAVTIEPDATADGLIHAFVGDRLGNGRIVSFSAAITGDLSASGVNGLDVGAFAPVKVYVWRLITPASGPGVALLASLSGATPILPPGYAYWSDIVCPVVTGPAPNGDVYECCHSRGGRNCFEFDVPNLGGIPILSNGVATVKTAIGQIRALSTIFPSERREGEIQLYYEAQNTSGTVRTVSVYNLDNAVYSLRGRQIGLAATPGEREQAAGNFPCLVDGATIDTSLWYDWSGAPTGGLSLWVDKIWI
jgi:hypothetical protein